MSTDRASYVFFCGEADGTTNEQCYYVNIKLWLQATGY